MGSDSDAPTTEQPRVLEDLKWPTEPPAEPPWGKEVGLEPNPGSPLPERPPISTEGASIPPPPAWPTLDLPPDPKSAPVSPGKSAVIGSLVGAVVAALMVASFVAFFDRNDATPVVSKESTVAPLDPSGSGANIQAILAKVQESVVTIETSQSTSRGVFQGAGSGIVLSEDGLVLTNNHVVEGSGEVTAVMFDGSTHKATLVGSFPDDDIALIQLEGVSGLKPAELGSSAALKVGDEAVAIGNALNLGGQPSVTLGIISALDRSIEAPGETLQGLIQTDAAINPGNSGGPLVNAAGQVVGVNTAIINDAQNIGFAIAIDTAKPLIEDIKAGRAAITPDTAFLGVATSDVSTVTEAVRDRFGVTSDTGAFIEEITPGSAADKGGLRIGDVITSVDGKAVTSPNDVQGAVRAKKAGDQIKLRVESGGTERTITVELGRKG